MRTDPTMVGTFSEGTANPIFTGAETNREFLRKGYVVVPFLDAEEIQAVQALHDRLFPVFAHDFNSSVMTATMDQRLGVLNGLRAIFGKKLEALLPRHRIQLASFMTKRPGSQRGSLPLHQDAWITDHQVEFAPSVWCPLVDVGPLNACLRVVAGSHRLVRNPCPLNAYVLPADYLTYKGDVDPLEDEFITNVPVPAGMALVYDPRLLHGSGENRTNQPRVAFNCPTVPDGYEPLLYWWDVRPPGQMHKFQVTESFLCQFQFGTRPEEPYPEGVRLLDTFDVPRTTFRLDRDVLRRLQREASIGI
jgi:hypothetical protein